MKDISGKTVVVGSKVATAIPRYRGLIVGEVIKLTPTGCQVLLKEGKYENKCFRGSSYISLVENT